MIIIIPSATKTAPVNLSISLFIWASESMAVEESNLAFKLVFVFWSLILSYLFLSLRRCVEDSDGPSIRVEKLVSTLFSKSSVLLPLSQFYISIPRHRKESERWCQVYSFGYNQLNYKIVPSSRAWRYIHKWRFLHQPSQHVIHIRKTGLLPKHLHENRSLGTVSFIFWRYT